MSDRKLPFPFEERTRAFHTSFNHMLRDISEKNRNQVLDPNNTLRYYHGRSWISHNATEPKDATTMIEVSHEMEISMRQIADGDFSILERNLNELAEKFHKSLMQNLYQCAGDAADRVGNTVSAKDRPFSDAFLDLLNKIEFGVDRQGNVSRPEIHMHPSMVEKAFADMRSRGPEYEAEVNKIGEEKAKAALQKEAERKARFRK